MHYSVRIWLYSIILVMIYWFTMLMAHEVIHYIQYIPYSTGICIETNPHIKISAFTIVHRSIQKAELESNERIAWAWGYAVAIISIILWSLFFIGIEKQIMKKQ